MFKYKLAIDLILKYQYKIAKYWMLLTLFSRFKNCSILDVLLHIFRRIFFQHKQKSFRHNTVDDDSFAAVKEIYCSVFKWLLFQSSFPEFGLGHRTDLRIFTARSWRWKRCGDIKIFSSASKLESSDAYHCSASVPWKRKKKK